MMRPQPCRWFEILVARDDAFVVLEALAAAACIEVEWHAGVPVPAVPAALLRHYEELARRYRPYWPAPAAVLESERLAPVDVLAAAVQTLRQWGESADALVGQLQAVEAELAELELAASALNELAASQIDFAALAQASQGVRAALFALPAGTAVEIPDHTIARSATLPGQQLLLALGTPPAIEALAHSVSEVNGRRARFPDWLQPSAGANLRLVEERRAELRLTAGALRQQLDALSERHDLGRALGRVARAGWCFEHGGAIDQGEVLARISGWTLDRPALVAALEASGARALATFPAPPRDARAPLVLRNPWWAQPYELFTRLVGMPGAGGADPSMLLALAVPLMFGYMFGDVGQGLVLVAAGWLLRNRLPVLRLLVPAGIAATAFGFVFGAVFTLETVIEPWWVHPIAHPLPVLLVPVIGGAVLMLLGLLIDAVEAWWEHRLDRWLREDAPVLLAFAGALLAFVSPIGFWLVAAGACWAVAAAAIGRHGLRAALTALGQLLEHTIQILINTLSFARVGAFALAHAGLSSAVVALAGAASNRAAWLLILVIGNLLILVVEGLVVSIQTTRLVLFEFFTRFFRPEGREFRPLAAPPVTSH
jgi:V/A-type H+-transporting ATPase subunit I